MELRTNTLVGSTTSLIGKLTSNKHDPEVNLPVLLLDEEDNLAFDGAWTVLFFSSFYGFMNIRPQAAFEAFPASLSEYIVPC